MVGVVPRHARRRGLPLRILRPLQSRHLWPLLLLCRCALACALLLLLRCDFVCGAVTGAMLTQIFAFGRVDAAAHRQALIVLPVCNHEAYALQKGFGAGALCRVCRPAMLHENPADTA
jgi:hypothetical protein